jgi:hypothetical protein
VLPVSDPHGEFKISDLRLQIEKPWQLTTNLQSAF